jgi:hypothetical protein
VSNEEPRERPLGWMLLTLAAGLALLLPIWLFVTALIIQLSPDLGGFGLLVEGDHGVVEGDSLRWFVGAARAAFVLALAMPFVGALLAVFAGTSWVQRLRSSSTRARYDAMVADDAVLDAGAWAGEEPEQELPG